MLQESSAEKVGRERQEARLKPSWAKHIRIEVWPGRKAFRAEEAGALCRGRKRRLRGGVWAGVGEERSVPAPLAEV